MKSKLLLVLALSAIFIATTTLAVAQQEYPLVIETVTTRDFNGNVKSEFKLGEWVIIDVTIYMPPEYYYTPTEVEYLLLIQIKDPNNVPIFIGFIKDKITPGERHSRGLGIKIPYDAATGVYKVKVMVWNGWPSEKGANWQALAEPYEITFTVTSS